MLIALPPFDLPNKQQEMNIKKEQRPLNLTYQSEKSWKTRMPMMCR